MTRRILGVSPGKRALVDGLFSGSTELSHLWKLATVDDWYVGNAGSVVTVKRQEGHNDSSLLQNLRSVHSVYPGPSTHMAQQSCECPGYDLPALLFDHYNAHGQ